jgi:hypothetical protein
MHRETLNNADCFVRRDYLHDIVVQWFCQSCKLYKFKTELTSITLKFTCSRLWVTLTDSSEVALRQEVVAAEVLGCVERHQIPAPETTLASIQWFVRTPFRIRHDGRRRRFLIVVRVSAR